MSGSWDADITLLYPVEAGRATPVDTVAKGESFDVVAFVKIGQNLMQVVDGCELFVSVRNLSAATVLLRHHESYPLAPQRAPLHHKLQVGFDAGWDAREGDVLDVVTTFKVTAGVNADYSCATTSPFIVVDLR